MGEMGGAQQPLHQRLSGFRAAAAITVVLAAAFFMTYGNATTIAPNWVNTTGGDLAEVGSLDGGGNPIQVNDHVQLNKNEVRNISKLNSEDTLTIASDQDASGSGVLSLWSGGVKGLQVLNGGGIDVLNGDLDLNDNTVKNVSTVSGGGDVVHFTDGIDSKSVNNIHYVGSGSSQYSDLQTAIDDLPGNGGTVVITEPITVSNTVTIPDAVRITGVSFEEARIDNGGVPSGESMLETDDPDYVFIDHLRISVNDKSVTAINLSNPSTHPAHVKVEDIHIVNCGTGINMINTEDSWIRGGRIGNCNVGINYTAPGGFGSIHGTHVVDSNQHSLFLGAWFMDMQDVVVGSENVTSHIKLNSDVSSVSMDSFWSEGESPVMDTGGSTLEHFSLTGASKIQMGGGESAFTGTYNNVHISALDFVDDDDTTVELFESKPFRTTAFNVKAGGTADWSNVGFTHFVSGLQGTDTDQGADIAGDVDVRAGSVDVHGNDISNVNKTGYSTNTGPTCDSGTEGDIQYNGTHHVGCDGSSWHALY